MQLPSTLIDYMRSASIALSVSPMTKPDLPLVFVNPRFCALTGYAPEEVLGTNCRFLQGERTEAAVVTEMRQFLADDARDNAQFEISNYRKNGELFRNAVFMSRLRASDGATLFVFASQFDLSTATDARALTRYDSALRTSVSKMRDVAREHEITLSTSVATLANAASTIARSKLYLGDT